MQASIYLIEIPIKSFQHAAASREAAESVLIKLQAGQTAGWGQALPREYVTGETIESVITDLKNLIIPALRDNPSTRLEDLSAKAGHCINSAFGAAETALMFTRADFILPDTKITSRVSGVLGSKDPAKTKRKLKLMRLYGIRDFKLKLGFSDEVDTANLQTVWRVIGKHISNGKCTLRVDANGAWNADQTVKKSEYLKKYGVCVIEQPVFTGAAELAQLSERCELPLMADESLISFDDAQTLAGAGSKIWFNIRISKNGGINACKKIADLATENSIPFVFGCMVGETSILSAAQRVLLQTSPAPRFIEGNYGKFLLSEDVTRKCLRFGYGGKLAGLKKLSSAIVVDEKKLEKFTLEKIVVK